MVDLLRVRDLKTYFFTEEGVVKACDGVSFCVKEGKTVSIVGETGSGKSVTVLSILKIVPKPAKILSGEALFRGRDLLQMSEKEMQKIRGHEIGTVFQDPSASLDPLYTIGSQLTEVIMHHKPLAKDEASREAIELFKSVGIPEPEIRADQYPHELSGGMKQRVAIARAVCCRPKLLIADEPTTALDVTIQAQILNLLKELRRQFNMSTILITHEMGVVAEMSDTVVVLYGGRVCEIAGTEAIFSNPIHPYTIALLEAVPRIDKGGKLVTIPGTVPDLVHPEPGCLFHPRCRYASSRCHEESPELLEVAGDHYVACWNPQMVS